MATNMECLQIFDGFDSGRVSEAETLRLFDKVQIRGAFKKDGSFIGYDYDQQIWIDETS